VPLIYGKDYEPGKGEHSIDKVDKMVVLMTTQDNLRD
jgi:hypothetical protein